MKLSQILARCQTSFFLENFFDFNVKDITADSRIVKNNYIFTAIKGIKENGEDYIEDIKKYKTAIIMSKDSIKQIKKNNSVYIYTLEVRKLFSEITSVIYKNSIKEKIAITGTNGKTSITDYARQIFEKLNKNVASMGTLGLIYKKKKIESTLTTPDTTILNKQLNYISKKKCETLLIEASSIGLEQYRLFPLKFDKVAFSNLSRDHLDYHKNFTNYKKSKSLLFQNHTKKKSIAVINSDDRYADFFLNICKKKKLKILDFGKNGKFLKFLSFKKKINGFEYQILLKKKKKKIFTKAISKYEIYNKVCALILIFGEKLNFSKFSLLNNLNNPPGRLDKIKDRNIFIDYAHTPDALKNVLSNLKKNCKGNLFSVIGCGGNRDKTKRPLMTKEALKFSDLVIITDDNPRNENPAKIRKDMINNLKDIEKKKIKEIADRRKAIMFSITLLKENDFLLIAGKGHENYQIVRNNKYFFSDKDVVEEIISELK